MFDEVHNVWMSDHAQCLDFSLNESTEVLVGIQNFHCKFVTKAVFSSLYFAAGTFTEGPSDLKVV